MNYYNNLFKAIDDYFETYFLPKYDGGAKFEAKFDDLVICLKKYSNDYSNFLKSFTESIFHLIIEEKISNPEFNYLGKYSKQQLTLLLVIIKEDLGVDFSEYTDSLFNACNKLMGKKISKKTKSDRQGTKLGSFYILLDIIKDVDDVRFIKFVDLYIQSLPEGITMDYGDKIFMFFIHTKYPIESMDVLKKHIENPPSDNDYVNESIEEVYNCIRDNKQNLPGFIWVNK